jgi:hypothetical protein
MRGASNTPWQSPDNDQSWMHLGITHLGHVMKCTGRVVEKLEYAGERCLRIEVQSANQFGQTKIVGEALVALP